MTAPVTNLQKQLAHQRRRRDLGQVRKYFWLDTDTLALYNHLIRQWPRQKDKMMAAALAALRDLGITP